MLYYNFYDDATGKWTGGGALSYPFDYEPAAAVHEGLLVESRRHAPGGCTGSRRGYIIKNPAIIEVLEEAIDIGTDITSEIVFKALGSLWDAKFLLNMIKIIAKSLGWWALGKLAIKLASMFIAGAQELQVATMLVNLTMLGVQLGLLARHYPGNK